VPNQASAPSNTPDAFGFAQRTHPQAVATQLEDGRRFLRAASGPGDDTHAAKDRRRQLGPAGVNRGAGGVSTTSGVA
jgi:hypothetical protein